MGDPLGSPRVAPLFFTRQLYFINYYFETQVRILFMWRSGSPTRVASFFLFTLSLSGRYISLTVIFERQYELYLRPQGYEFYICHGWELLLALTPHFFFLSSFLSFLLRLLILLFLLFVFTGTICSTNVRVVLTPRPRRSRKNTWNRHKDHQNRTPERKVTVRRKYGTGGSVWNRNQWELTYKNKLNKTLWVRSYQH